VEVVSCDLCGSDDAGLLFEGSDRWFKLPGRFPVRQCRACGLIYLSPRPGRDEIGTYYPPGYVPFSPAIEDEPSAWRRFNRRHEMGKRLRLVRSLAGTPGAALDVGCATGVFLDALRRHGWEVCGVEIEEQAAAYARSRLNLSVRQGDLREAGFAARSFDLVTMWYVLEHVHQPRATLVEAARVARPGGALILALPNPDGLEARLFGPDWSEWDTPRHLHLFTKAVIRRLLTDTGWQVLKITGVSARMWSLHQSLRYRLEACAMNARLRKAILACAGSEPVRAACLPYFEVVERLNLSSGMVVLARRA
jgi:2-polyprenyl-3-methyl-5-hydroxy-6-metoxy-1,4-benzoquinol methylase